jgi:hypothetical protein
MLRTLRRDRHALLGLLLLASATATACSNAGEGLGINLPGGRNVVAQLYFDRDFNNAPVPTAADTTMAGIPVYLLVAGTQDTVGTDTTDATGTVNFPSVPAGPYTIAVDSAKALGDSLVTVLTPSSVTVTGTGSAPFILARLGYPVVGVSAARASAVGRKVVVNGTILAGPQTFSDTTANLRDASGAVRLTAAAVTVGGFVTPGDTVRVLGIVAVRAGQRVLDEAQIVLLRPGLPSLQADTLSTAAAASAQVAARDADLIFVNGAPILDTTTTAGAAFLVTVDDGSGPLEVVFDSLLQVNTAVFIPGDSLKATGVLVPIGGAKWQLRPRSSLDATVF